MSNQDRPSERPGSLTGVNKLRFPIVTIALALIGMVFAWTKHSPLGITGPAFLLAAGVLALVIGIKKGDPL